MSPRLSHLNIWINLSLIIPDIAITDSVSVTVVLTFILILIWTFIDLRIFNLLKTFDEPEVIIVWFYFDDTIHTVELIRHFISLFVNFSDLIDVTFVNFMNWLLLLKLEIQLSNNQLEDIWLNGLWQHLVHTTVNGFLHVLHLSVSCDSKDDRLLNIFVKKVGSYHPSWLVSIHEGHVAVHQNEIVRAFLEIIEYHILLYFFKRLQSILCRVYDLISSQQLYSIFEDYGGRINVETLVIYDQDLLLEILNLPPIFDHVDVIHNITLWQALQSSNLF